VVYVSKPLLLKMCGSVGMWFGSVSALHADFWPIYTRILSLRWGER